MVSRAGDDQNRQRLGERRSTSVKSRYSWRSWGERHEEYPSDLYVPSSGSESTKCIPERNLQRMTKSRRQGFYLKIIEGPSDKRVKYMQGRKMNWKTEDQSGTADRCPESNFERWSKTQNVLHRRKTDQLSSILLQHLSSSTQTGDTSRFWSLHPVRDEDRQSEFQGALGTVRKGKDWKQMFSNQTISNQQVRKPVRSFNFILNANFISNQILCNQFLRISIFLIIWTWPLFN